MEVGHCNACDSDKPASKFYKHPDGSLRKPCKSCNRTRARAAYREGDAGSDRVYDQLLRREYGITLEQYNAMLRQQAGRCAICRRAETVTYKKTGKVRRLAVDHDHVTKAIRALLCFRCNVLVWAIEDNHTTLSAISAYVEQWRETFAYGAPT